MSKKRKSPSTQSASLPRGFSDLLGEVKLRIQAAQARAMAAVNADLVRLYWDVGRLIHTRQREQGWGARIIPRLASELRNELPEIKGFSERNIGRMIAFYREYANPEIFPQPAAKIGGSLILPPPVAKLGVRQEMPPTVAQIGRSPIMPQPAAKLPGSTILPPLVAKLADSILWAVPWIHHVILLEKVKDLPARIWYMQQTLAHGWSRNVLTLQIDSQAHQRTGKAVTNFDGLLPSPQSDLARETLKDPYIFDFLTLTEPFHEKELETELIRHVQKFLLELGQGFAFVGRQYRVTVNGEDFHIDLLFYQLRLRAFVVIDLKTGAFKPEYAGKINLYCNVVNDQLRHADDQPTIGLILCQTKDNILAEYALAGINKPIGVSSYELTRALPKRLQSALPTVEQIEAELRAGGGARSRRSRAAAGKRQVKRKSSPEKRTHKRKGE